MDFFTPETIARHTEILAIVGDGFVALDQQPKPWQPQIENWSRGCYRVSSQSSEKVYQVCMLGKTAVCSCPDHKSRRHDCKHIRCVAPLWEAALALEAEAARKAAIIERRRVALTELGFDEWAA